MNTRRALTLLVALSVAVPFDVLAGLDDGIDLRIGAGPGPSNVTLNWTGGLPTFEVFRSLDPTRVLDPANKLGAIATSLWVDAPPPGGATFYNVTSTSSPPLIQRITPSGASFGDFVTIYGSGFGTDPSVVTVRFSFVEPGSGESLVIDQPVFVADSTRIDLAVPMAVPDRINKVRVLVNGSPSPIVDYLVGPLPLDPTPGVAGNETLRLVDDLATLVGRFDAKLGTWLVTTGTASQAQADAVHNSMSQALSAIAQLRDDVSGRTAQELAITDSIIGTPALQDVQDRLTQAINALHGSPLGTVMCEGLAIKDIVQDILDVLDVVNTVLSIVSTALDVACAAATIAAIFTLAIASPIAVALCAAAAAVDTIVRPIMEAIGAISSAVDAIASAAPVDPVGPSYDVSVTHPLWPDESFPVYVQGAIPVEARASSDFENAQCAVNGCDVDFSITIFGIPIPISITVPHIVVQNLPLTCTLQFPPGPGGVPGYSDLGTADGDAACIYTGADVNGPAWERGVHSVNTSSACASLALGPITKSHLLVSGPKLFSVTPAAAQLGAPIQLQGQYLPPLPGAVPGSTLISFGDTIVGPFPSGANAYSLPVPDTIGAAGITMTIQGRPADQALAFSVLPPVLTFSLPNPGFAGEVVQVRGTGFAYALSNNVLTLDGAPMPLQSSPTGIAFEIPASAMSGPLQLTAMGVHVSNVLPFGFSKWLDPAPRASHPNRDAANPVVAALPDGSVGIAWIDRNASGGKVRLLFTDVSPGDASFRAPIVITDQLAGLPSAPQTPDVAAGPDGRFHVVWGDPAGNIRMASFAKGTVPSGPLANRIVLGTPYGTTPSLSSFCEESPQALRDPTVAVMSNGHIHVAATSMALDGCEYPQLIQMRSINGGATFVRLEGFPLSAPTHIGQAPPGSQNPPTTDNNVLFGGDIDLSFANGRLWRAFTKRCSINSIPPCPEADPTGTPLREIIVESSADGSTFVPVEVGSLGQRIYGPQPLAGFQSPFTDVVYDQDGTILSITPVPKTAQNRLPSVSGDALGPIVAWDTMLFGRRPLATQPVFATRAVMASSLPGHLVQELTPTGVNFQNDGGRPSLVVFEQAAASVVTMVWTERELGGPSPDFVNGVPRLRFTRSIDRLASTTISSPGRRPVAPPAPETIDARPSLSLDASGQLHLVWLEGPEGHRVVRYSTSATVAYADVIADDPPMITETPRSLMVVKYLNAAAGSRIFLLDVDRPTERYWISVTTMEEFNVTYGSEAGSPSFRPGKAELLFDSGEWLGPTLSNLNDDTAPFASDDPGAGDAMGMLFSPIWMPDGRVVAERASLDVFHVSPTEPRIWLSDAGSGHFSPVANGDPRGDMTPGVSRTGRFIAFLSSTGGYSSDVDRMQVLDLTGGLSPSIEATPLGFGGLQTPNRPVWSPTQDKVAWIQSRQVPDGLGGFYEVTALVESEPGIPGVTEVGPPASSSRYLAQPAYSPDGSDLAYVCSGDTLGSCAPEFVSGGQEIGIKLTSGGLVPESGWLPVWSQDGSRIAFTSRLGGNSIGAGIKIWTVGAPSVGPELVPINVWSLTWKEVAE